jgi:hypothetical protein
MSLPDFMPSLGDVLTGLIPTNVQQDAAPAFLTRSLGEKITVYYMPISATPREKKCVMVGLTLCGRCVDPAPGRWQSYVLSWSLVVFPELVQQCQSDTTAVDYSYEVFPQDFITSCVDAVMAQGDEATVGDRFVTFPPGLPNATLVPVTAQLVEACKLEGLYAYYAMLIFIMGKSLSPESVTAISTKRPDALIRKRSLTTCKYILVEDGKLLVDNYARVQSGWVRSTRPRILIVRHLAILNAADNSSELLDSICVNMDMLRNSGQTYIYYIHELLTACPWAIEIPSLRAAFYHYVRMCNVLNTQPAWLKPYYKLMMQDSTKEVRRRGIEPLTAVATFFAAQTRQTMARYRVDASTLPAVQAFQALARTKGIVFADINQQATTTTIAI